MKITNFGSAEHRLLSAAIQKAISDVADEFGVDIRVGGGNVGSTKGMIKVEVAVRDTGTGKSAAQVEFEAYCHWYGLAKEDFGRTFISNRDLFRVSGVLPRGQRFTISADRVSDGRRFKFTADTVKRSLTPLKAAA